MKNAPNPSFPKLYNYLIDAYRRAGRIEHYPIPFDDLVNSVEEILKKSLSIKRDLSGFKTEVIKPKEEDVVENTGEIFGHLKFDLPGDLEYERVLLGSEYKKQVKNKQISDELGLLERKKDDHNNLCSDVIKIISKNESKFGLNEEMRNNRIMRKDDSLLRYLEFGRI